MRTKPFLGLLAVTALTAISGGVHASPVAMATNMVGKPMYREGDAGDWKTLGVLQRLSPGDTVKCGPGEQAIVMMFMDGVRFKVDANEVATVAPTTVKGAEALGGAGGATIRVAKAMTGLDSQAFLARPGQEYERLDPTSPGIVIDTTTQFQWLPLDDAVTYSFTLFDSHDDVVWSTRVVGTSAQYPSDIPPPLDKRPYVWMVSGFGDSGKPVPKTRWGIITFLAQADADQLTKDAADLKAEMTSDPSDTTPLLVLAEEFRQYGVLEGTLETLDDTRLAGQPGLSDARQSAFAQISPLAMLLERHDSGQTTPAPAAPTF
jgi:hypothetical protein